MTKKFFCTICKIWDSVYQWCKQAPLKTSCINPVKTRGRFHKRSAHGANHRDSSIHLRSAPALNFLRSFILAQSSAQGAKLLWNRPQIRWWSCISAPDQPPYCHLFGGSCLFFFSQSRSLFVHCLISFFRLSRCFIFKYLLMRWVHYTKIRWPYGLWRPCSSRSGLPRGVVGVLYLIIEVHQVPLRYRLTLLYYTSCNTKYIFLCPKLYYISCTTK